MVSTFAVDQGEAGSKKPCGNAVVDDRARACDVYDNTVTYCYALL